MEVLEAMRRRRMHRSFDPSPLDEPTLQKLAWAATRAPAGGNQPSRYVLVVNDPRLVKTVVEVSPSYIGTLPAAILLVLTDINNAERQIKTQNHDHLSHTDANTATKHIILTTINLNLKYYLFHCSNKSALRAVLDLPPYVRVEGLCAVGRPAPTPSPAMKAPKQTVFLDTWGAEWEVRRP